jgi:hypothetical protein
LRSVIGTLSLDEALSDPVAFKEVKELHDNLKQIDDPIAARAIQADQVRLVCNRWGRCWHVGGYRYRGGYRRGYRGRHW